MKERSLISVLNGFQRLELEDLGNILGREFEPRMRKAQLVDDLADYLVNKPRKWLSHLTERDIRLLKTLVHAGPGKVQYLDYPDYTSFLEISGIIDYDDSDEHYHKVWIRREIYDIVAPHVDAVIKAVEKSGRFDVERVALGYLNLYGILPYEQFADLMTDWWEECGHRSFEKLVDHLEESPIIKLNRFTDRNGDYLCSPCMAHSEDFFALREDYPEVNTYQTFTAQEAREAGSGAPYFSIGLKTPEGVAFVALLKEFGFDGFELVKAEHDVWMEAQMPEGNDHVFDILYEKQEFITSMDRLRRYVNVFAAYADSVPKWALKGHSAAETGFLRVEADPERLLEDMEGEALLPDADAGDSYPHWTMPSPTVSDGYALPKGFPFGLAVPHVAPDDPCPCCSGLKYRFCHGKILN